MLGITFNYSDPSFRLYINTNTLSKLAHEVSFDIKAVFNEGRKTEFCHFNYFFYSEALIYTCFVITNVRVSV